MIEVRILDGRHILDIERALDSWDGPGRYQHNWKFQHRWNLSTTHYWIFEHHWKVPTTHYWTLSGNMISPILLPLILLPLPLSIILPKKRTFDLPAFYESLRELPRLPSNPTLLDQIRYNVHRAYFQYLVTGPGYVLEPAERICFDALIFILLASLVWCASFLVAPVLLNVMSTSLLGTERASYGKADGMGVQNMSMGFSVRRIFGPSTEVSVMRNVTSTPVLGF